MAVKTLAYILERLKLTLSQNVCPICNAAPRTDVAETICHPCQKRLMMRQPEPVVSTPAGSMFAACHFPFRMKQLLYGLKFDGQTHYGPVLAEILTQYWGQLPHSQRKNWIVVPVPPHQESEFSPVPYFARPFASHFGYDFIEDALQWRRFVQPQHTLPNKRKRRENLAGAFRINPARIAQLKQGSQILIVDDMMTTGTTLAEALVTIQYGSLGIPATAMAVSHVPLALSRMPKEIA